MPWFPDKGLYERNIVNALMADPEAHGRSRLLPRFTAQQFAGPTIQTAPRGPVLTPTPAPEDGEETTVDSPPTSASAACPAPSLGPADRMQAVIDCVAKHTRMERSIRRRRTRGRGVLPLQRHQRGRLPEDSGVRTGTCGGAAEALRGDGVILVKTKKNDKIEKQKKMRK